MTTIATSAAKCAANQKNSHRTTGPVIPAGKAKMRKNAIRHGPASKHLGLTSIHVVIDGEDSEEYNSLRQDSIDDWQPATTQESSVVTEIAEAAWRMTRNRRIETETCQNYFEAAGLTNDPDRQNADSYHENANFFDNRRRYSTTIGRTFFCGITELGKRQKERKKSERGSVSQNAANLADSSRNPLSAESLTQPPPTESGSVSQTTYL